MTPDVWPRDRLIRVCRWLLQAAGRVVPRVDRDEWVEEWEAELFVLQRRGAGAGVLLRYVLGCAANAIRERCEGEMMGLGQDIRLGVRRLRHR
ncbi:MAG: hypothetical protein IH968_16615 [Gemmatimonadetes bacterium]|nr:hypothetical protein [Gemmatimonadota bacterium]